MQRIALLRTFKQWSMGDGRHRQGRDLQKYGKISPKLVSVCPTLALEISRLIPFRLNNSAYNVSHYTIMAPPIPTVALHTNLRRRGSNEIKRLNKECDRDPLAPLWKNLINVINALSIYRNGINSYPKSILMRGAPIRRQGFS